LEKTIPPIPLSKNTITEARLLELTANIMVSIKIPYMYSTLHFVYNY
jgi:hypothetical protein